MIYKLRRNEVLGVKPDKQNVDFVGLMLSSGFIRPSNVKVKLLTTSKKVR